MTSIPPKISCRVPVSPRPIASILSGQQTLPSLTVWGLELRVDVLPCPQNPAYDYNIPREGRGPGNRTMGWKELPVFVKSFVGADMHSAACSHPRLGADPYRRAGRTWAPAAGFEAESCLCPWRSRPWLRQGFWACKTKAVAIPLLAVLRSVAKVTRGHVFHRFLSVVCQTRVGWVR